MRGRGCDTTCVVAQLDELSAALRPLPPLALRNRGEALQRDGETLHILLIDELGRKCDDGRYMSVSSRHDRNSACLELEQDGRRAALGVAVRGRPAGLKPDVDVHEQASVLVWRKHPDKAHDVAEPKVLDEAFQMGIFRAV